MRLLLPITLALAAWTAAGAHGPQDEAAALERALEESGMRLDLAAGAVSIPVSVLVKDDLLEYLLVGMRGASHESLFATTVRPSLLNTALLLLGAEPGSNARWEEVVDPGPDEDSHRVLLPAGDGFLLYVAWREDEETYFFRVEDLLSNLETGRSMRRHHWVFLGSRFDVPGEGEPEVFVADVEENLINVSFFFQGNTLLTAALRACEQQTIWVANPWLLPDRDTPVELIFARERLVALPAGWEEALPRAARGVGDERGDGR